MLVDADTVAAIATPPGQGGIAVIRVSGPQARAILAVVFRPHGGRAPADEPRRVYTGWVVESSGAAIDEAVVFTMPGPHSYTGEDVVEIQCHGGTVVSRRVLEIVLAAGARPAAPGEFTKRAFINGRMDLAQAEAVADLIAARAEASRRLAWSQLEGVLSSRLGKLREAIVQARALCEAAIDFPDEDLPDVAARLSMETQGVDREIAALLASFERARLRFEGARVAIVGKPNVGKSSLLNLLAGRERAIVTPIPGTTRDVVEVVVALEDVPVTVCDTAGIRDTPDPVERAGVSRSRDAVADAHCAVIVVDGSRPLDDDDRLVFEALGSATAIVAVNKIDLPRCVDGQQLAIRAGGRSICEISAATGEGLDVFMAALARQLLGGPADGASESDDEAAIFRVRHRDAARRAAEAIDRAVRSLAERAPLELTASDLAAAATALDEITGSVTSEDVLDRVFAEFCIGK